ncbi:MAG: transposase [Candidatus Omnitrophica bacterium]|nr:transposase [Candidatus Omnitrophota bacterium]
MSYYRLLNLQCEPFSTSPDPHFFYLSRVHRAALFRTRIAIELRRGLSVVAGDIGTGKTTMARKLSQIFSHDPRIDFHAILNPMDQQNDQFLRTLLNTFHIPMDELSGGPVNCLHAIEKYLFQKGLKEKKTVVLLIDEAQLLSHQSLEILRALLNYETNEFKLLQLILNGQLELIPRLQEVPNFWDRISLKLLIPPLDEQETLEMIHYRLHQAQYPVGYPLFSEGALKMIYQKSQGYPRRVNVLCHDALEYLVMMGLTQVDEQVIYAVSRVDDEMKGLSFPQCHSEALFASAEGSKNTEILRFAQNDNKTICVSPEEDNGMMFPLGFVKHGG